MLFRLTTFLILTLSIPAFAQSGLNLTEVGFQEFRIDDASLRDFESLLSQHGYTRQPSSDDNGWRRWINGRESFDLLVNGNEKIIRCCVTGGVVLPQDTPTKGSGAFQFGVWHVAPYTDTDVMAFFDPKRWINLRFELVPGVGLGPFKVDSPINWPNAFEMLGPPSISAPEQGFYVWNMDGKASDFGASLTVSTEHGKVQKVHLTGLDWSCGAFSPHTSIDVLRQEMPSMEFQTSRFGTLTIQGDGILFATLGNTLGHDVVVHRVENR